MVLIVREAGHGQIGAIRAGLAHEICLGDITCEQVSQGDARSAELRCQVGFGPHLWGAELAARDRLLGPTHKVGGQ